LVVGGNDFAKSNQRCTDQVHASHQFFFSIWINAIDDRGQHIKCVRQHALRKCKATLDVVEKQTVWLIRGFDLFDQQSLQLGVGYLLGGFHDQIRLPGYNMESLLASPMSVRAIEALDRRS